VVKSISLPEILELAKHLSLLDKVRLIEELAPQIEHDLKANAPQLAERTSAAGLWEGVSTSEEDIAAARAEMWGNFPREDA
jgi:hypothetical protein